MQLIDSELDRSQTVSFANCRRISEILPSVLAQYGLTINESAEESTTMSVHVGGLIAEWSETSSGTAALCSASS